MAMDRDEIVRRLPRFDRSLAYPSEDSAPVFRQPWEAKAFAMVVHMHAKGLFTWKEWVQHLTAVIAAAAEDDPDEDGSRYYYHWLAACERLLEEKGISTDTEIAHREAEVVRDTHHAHEAQKHGHVHHHGHH